jgi:transcription termination factor NusA
LQFQPQSALVLSLHQLGVDAEVAGVLIDEGFSSVDDIADADAASLETVEEFDTTMVEELQERVCLSSDSLTDITFNFQLVKRDANLIF